MNKKFLSAILFGALAVASTGSFVSCKDYDDDIKNLQTQIGQLANKQDLQSQVSTLQSAISTAQSAAENKAAAAQKAADEAKAAVEAAAAKAAAATTEAEKAAADAAAAKAAADAAAAKADLEAANAKIAELAKAAEAANELIATLAKDSEATKDELKVLNDKVAALEAKVGETTGTKDMTGISLVDEQGIVAGYGLFKGVKKANNQATTWDGPKAEKVAALAPNTYLTAFGNNTVKVSVNPTGVDPTKIDFAVVNQYGDQAPVAFSEPKAPTRAEAGVYEMTYTAGELNGVDMEKLAKNFNENMPSAIKAGKFATIFKNGFCQIQKIENKDFSTFTAVVKYADLESGKNKVEVKAVNPERVYDSYIVVGGKNQLDTHDSLVYNVSYNKNEMAIEFNAAKIKQALDGGKAAPVMIFTIAQLNVNGYVKTDSKVTVVFEAKPAGENIKAEDYAFETATEHEIVANYYDKEIWDVTDLQKEEIAMASALKFWNVADTKTEEGIHWAHSRKGAISKAGTPYIINDYGQETPIAVVDTVIWGKDNKSVFVKFTSDYAYTGQKSSMSEDPIMNGKNDLYIPVKFTATDDADVAEVVKTDYTATLKVSFKPLDTKKLYKINDGKAIKVDATGETSASYDFAADGVFKSVYKTAASGADIDLVKLAKTSYTRTKKSGKTVYVTPGVTVTGQLNGQYKMRVAELDKEQYADEDAYNAEVKKYELAYMNSAYMTDNTSNRRYAYAATEKDSDGKVTKWGWSVAGSDRTAYSFNNYKAVVTNAFDTVAISTTTTPNALEKAVEESYKFYVSAVDGALGMLNTTYTVKGLQAEVMGRTFDLDDIDVTVYNESEATATMSISTSLNKNANYLYNALYKPAVGENFDGSFSIKNAAGKTLDIANFTSATIKAYEITDGVASLTETPGFAIAAELYKDDAKLDDPNRTGMKISVPETAAGKKFKVVININTKLANVTSNPNMTKFEVVVEVNE